MISRNDPCFCGSGKKWKKCCYPLKDQSQFPNEQREKYRKQYGILLKTEKQITGIRKACLETAKLLQKCVAAAKAGVTTNELDQIAQDYCKKHNYESAPLGYGDPLFQNLFAPHLMKLSVMEFQTTPLLSTAT